MIINISEHTLNNKPEFLKTLIKVKVPFKIKRCQPLISSKKKHDFN